MLKTSVMAEENYHSFLRPAVYESIKKVLKFYGLEDASRIYYNGENEISKLIGSNIDDRPLSDIQSDGAYANKLFVVAEFSDTEFNTGYANQRRTPTERPVWFHDDEIHTAIYPGFVGMKVDVGITVSFNSLKATQQFRNRINRQTANQMVEFTFDPTVHLTVNPGIVALLEDIHKLYQKNDPTTPDFVEWFNKGKRSAFTIISNAAGNNKRLVVPMKKTGIGIQLSEPEIARSRKGSTHGKYEVEVRYFFYLNHFTHWDLEYPLSIYQDDIPSEWIPAPQEGYSKSPTWRKNYETAMTQTFERADEMQSPFFLKLPDYDPWTMSKIPWINPVVQARLTTPSEPNSELVKNVFDIPGFTWNERAEKYMRRRHEKAHIRHDVPYPIYIYEADLPLHHSRLSMTTDGLITTTDPMDVRRTTRLMLTVDYAIRDYSQDFWDDLAKHPEDLPILVDLFPWYPWDRWTHIPGLVLPPGWGGGWHSSGWPWYNDKGNSKGKGNIWDLIDDLLNNINKGHPKPPEEINTYWTVLGSLTAYKNRG